MKLVAALLLACALVLPTAGCVTSQAVGGSPQVQVYAIQSDYIATVQIAQKYKDLPRCGGPTKPTLCSDSAIVKRMQQADNYAYTSLVEAEKAVRTTGFGQDQMSTVVATARAAVNAFSQLAKQHEVK